MANHTSQPSGVLVGIVHRFLTSQLSIILIILSLCLGFASLWATPREEEPQIVVPMADIYVHAPGVSPEEVEKLVATPLERLLWQIDGVEYVYSLSRRDMAIVTVRFYVGEDRENSLVKLHNKIAMNTDLVPSIVHNWVIKPIEIDDVPIVNLTMYSKNYDDHVLRRIGEETLARLSEVVDISRTEIVGGRKREIRVELIPDRMSGLGVTLLEIQHALKGADASVTVGTFDRKNQSFDVTSHSFLSSASEVAGLMVGVHNSRPIYIRDLAEVIDGPEEAKNYSRIGFSRSYRKNHDLEGEPHSFPAVTLSLSKKKGTNAVAVSQRILEKLEELKQSVIPEDVRIEVTRDYGETAQRKVNDLLQSLVFAVLTVVILLAVFLGWREALVVALAVPISFSLALFVNYLFGYTINRVTLFALILSLGLVVDDPITNVDNIQRHILAGVYKPIQATLFAVNEVLPPVIMSTFAIIVCFTPLFFITGMMGPYMAPMAANVPMTVIFSTLCALTIVPWLTHLLLKKAKHGIVVRPHDDGDSQTDSQTTIERLYRAVVSPFLESKFKRYLLLLGIIGLLCIPVVLVLFRLVPLKMLPFDNKNELQIIIDMPEGTPTEYTDRVVRQFEDYLYTVPEVTNFVSTTGHASPMDFNGMVRHYFLREGGHLADIRINFVRKSLRKAQSHEIALRIRTDLEQIASRNDAAMQIIELPPGPPVLSTLVAEIYGKPHRSHGELIQAAGHVKTIMEQEPFVVDIDVMAEKQRSKIDFVIDKEKAALHGVTTNQIIQSLEIALGGATPANVHIVGERHPLVIRTILPREKRSGMGTLFQIPIKSRSGSIVDLAELVKPITVPERQPIYHKNLSRVVYVIGETAGRAPAEAIIDMQARLKTDPPMEGTWVSWSGEGEWKITLRVFRDMGIAFGAALVGIYILLIIQTGSFFMPALIMMAIPLTLIGAMPGFWLLNVITGNEIGGFSNPVFFTATGMIGMIALGGIVIRNSLILIEFIQGAQRRGIDFKESILKSGAIRMRPILLTAATTALGAWPITLDPIFSGLAWTLIFGLFASTLFTLLVVPVTYFALYRSSSPSGGK